MRRKQYKAAKDQWRAANSNKDRESKRKSEEKLRMSNPARSLFIDARNRAKEGKLEFSLVIGDITIPEVCPVLGIPLFKSKKARSNNSPSMDRFDNTKGYTKENIRIISWQANRMKGEMTPDDIEKVYRYMKGQV